MSYQESIDRRKATVPPEVIDADYRIEALARAAHTHMKAVEHLLLHRLARKDGHLYRVTRVGIAMGGKHITLDGVRAGGKKDGTRVFDIGYAIPCEFVDEAKG